ncbi:MAG: 3-octaprenyl-4-hydroxybenzoate carboxy-lyase [Chloroflexi bacterium]|nr:MAG: 3-octaprenyl-4-hydroxybenzoate carboxy-lyase [Chloroflexota bacterium]
MTRKRLIVGISGASGVVYGIRLLEVLAERPEIETHLVVSQAAGLILAHETDCTLSQVEALAAHAYPPADLEAPIASGSFATDGMVIAPCSIKTLSAIANSYAADLLSRAADATLKEGRPLVLVVRETPLHLGHLRLMVRAAEIGALIFPPIPAFYGHPQTVAEIVDGVVGRVLARLGVENELYARWKDQ